MSIIDRTHMEGERHCFAPCPMSVKMNGQCTCENRAKNAKYYKKSDDLFGSKKEKS